MLVCLKSSDPQVRGDSTRFQRIAERARQERRDARNQDLRLAPVSLDVPVAHLRG